MKSARAAFPTAALWAAAGLWLAGIAAAPGAAVYVSFQEGDVRTGAGREAVTTNGALVTASFNMGGTYIRSDSATTVRDGTNLIAGTQSSGNRMRPLLSFNLSHLTNILGTNFSRIDSAALILTHESPNPGLGGTATVAVHLTRPFNETNATWNNPHGDSLDAGGWLGTELRERTCTNTLLAPAREVWGSPAWFWADGGTGPDLLVQAVREAMTNSTQTLNLLVKKLSETSADIFSRFKSDNDATVNYRPELLVGIDSISNPPVTISVVASDAAASEAGPGTGTFTILRGGNTNPAVTVSFLFSGSATLNTDFAASPAGSVTLLPGVTNAVVTITPADDVAPETNETVVIALQSDPAYVLTGSSAVVTIADDDAPHPLAAYGFNENDHNAPALSFVALPTVVDGPRVFAGNATAGVGLGQFGAGTNTGSTHGYGTGGYVSPPTGFYVRGSVTHSNLADALGADDYVSFTVGPQVGYAAHFTAVSARVKWQAATNLSATVVVRSSQDGFSNTLATLTVAGNGSSNTFFLLTNSLGGPAFTTVVEPVEFRLYVFDQSDNTGDIDRLDDVMFFGSVTNLPPGMQVVTLTAIDPAATESGGDAGAFMLQRFGDTAGALSVSYTISGTASNGVDFAWLSGTTNFVPGITNVAIPVNPLNDNRAEPVENVVLTLLPGAGFTLVGPESAEVEITDDNDPPEFVIAATTPLAYEPVATFSGVCTVTRALGDTNAAVSVRLALSGTASNGVDYTANPALTVGFAAGQMTATVTITPLDDALLESPETVVVTLLPGGNYSVGAADSAIVTVFDDEGAANGNLLVEAESFATKGGWVVDQQFVDSMGSPYLLAHGKGHPVNDAITTVQFPVTGAYRLWVRTKDWTAPLPYHPGSFKVVVGGVEVTSTFGTVGQGWLWQDGGMVMVTNTTTEIRLRDLTGFDGRCDALYFTTDPTVTPTNALPGLTDWRRAQLGLPEVPPSAGEFDLVVVGGGVAGSCAAVAAARQGIKVALIHDRPFPGGNASRDVRVHTLGHNPGGIVDELNTPDFLIGSDQFIAVDQQRMDVLLAETNIHLFTEWRAFAVQTNGARILSVDAKHTHSGEERRFNAPLFVDSTGDGWIGYWAGAQFRRGREARGEFNESLAPVISDNMTMGNTLSWNSRNMGVPVAFPAVPWATNVSKDYVATRGDWWWEYGLLLDTVYDAEEVRDHLFQAIYGSFANAKKLPANVNLDLDWVAHIAGKRESRRFVGDHTLVESDVRNHPRWPDAVVVEGREIDIHYPKPGIYDWQTYAQFTSVADYWIPFRCLYSTNVDNLMMAGRCLSASHVGLGSPRVMNTCGQMGVAVGAAAALCTKYNTSPRGVAERLMPELQEIIHVSDSMDFPSNTVCIVDNADAARVEITGVWTNTRSLPAYFDRDYLQDGNTGKGEKSVRFRPDVPMSGNYQVYMRWTVSGDRSDSVPVDIIGDGVTNTISVDQTYAPTEWVLLGTYGFAAGNAGSILIRNDYTFGQVVADAILLAADFPLDAQFTGRPWQDDDGDGLDNYVEFLHGTNPRDPASFATINLNPQAGASSLSFLALAGKTYTVLYRDSLSSGEWQKLADVPAENLTRQVTVPITPPDPQAARFYRLVTPSLP